MSHLLTVDAHLGVAARLRYLDKGAELVPRADAPRDSPSLADSSEEGSTASETGHPVAPASRALETSCLVPGRDAEVLGDLPQEGVYTITSARTLSTRHAYALKLNLFVEWCSSHREDPGKCPIRVVLSFLQQRLERRLSPSILKLLCGYDCCQPRPRGWEVGGCNKVRKEGRKRTGLAREDSGEFYLQINLNRCALCAS